MSNIKFNEKYSINNGQESILFKEGKGNTVTGEYQGGSLTGTMEGNVLKATYHNQKNNSVGLIEITFHENGFNAKWKQGLEPGPMKGKWKGLMGVDEKPNNSAPESANIVGIYAAQFDDETEELLPISDAEEKPFIIAIGFFGSHLVGSENEWYGFVGYVITNTCDKCRTESVLFMDEIGQTLSAHDMGGEAIAENDTDLVAAFKEVYPNEWSQIQEYLDEYFYCTEEEQDNETLYLSIKREIPESILLSNLYSGDWLDLEEVKKNSGSSVGIMVEL
jgi:hypothetical protein